MMQQSALAAHALCKKVWSVCSITGCLLLCACGGAQTASSPARGGDGITSYDLPSSPAAGAPSYSAPYTAQPVSPQGSQGSATPGYAGGSAAPAYGQPQAQPYGYTAPAQNAAPAYAPQSAPAQPQAAGVIAPAWRPLAARLAADGLSGPRVDALLATLNATPTQSPMGRKMRELYNRKFFPKPPSTTPAAQYYKGVLTEANAQLCRDFVAQNKRAFDQASARFGVPSSIAVSLLFVETRLGKVLADVP